MATSLRQEPDDADQFSAEDSRPDAPPPSETRTIQPERPPRAALEFPIPLVELLPQPWRVSPWLARGIYAGYSSPAIGPLEFRYGVAGGASEIGRESIWVAVDEHGREVAIARWGNWDLERAEPRALEIERMIAVGTAMFDVLEETDGQTNRPEIEFTRNSDKHELPTCVGAYPNVSPAHRDMLARNELLAPGLHIAPLRGRAGQPLICVIGDDWRLTAIVDVAAVGAPFFAGPASAHPFDTYRSACKALKNLLPPGVHIAPWLPTSSSVEAVVDLVGLDRHSRVVSHWPNENGLSEDVLVCKTALLAEHDPIIDERSERNAAADELRSALERQYRIVDAERELARLRADNH